MSGQKLPLRTQPAISGASSLNALHVSAAATHDLRATAKPASPKKTGKKKKKRERGQKSKVRAVVAMGEDSQERKLRHGKVRHLDILRSNYESHGTKLSRKNRELLSRMAKFNGTGAGSGVQAGGQAAREQGEHGRGGQVGRTLPSASDTRKRSGSNLKSVASKDSDEDTSADERPESRKNGGAAETWNDAALGLKSPKKKRFEGMQDGENFAQFSIRLRKESKKIIIDAARKGNHQREKKKAFYEKRRICMEHKKKRRRGEMEDSDVENREEDDEAYRATAHLPGYWQEILRNNGRPVSTKQRKKLRRADATEEDHVAFGEQVERPPQFSAIPVRRGGK